MTAFVLFVALLVALGTFAALVYWAFFWTPRS